MINDDTRFDPLSPAGASVPGFPIGERPSGAGFCRPGNPHFFAVNDRRFAFLFFAQQVSLRRTHEPHSPAALGFTYQPSLDVAVGPPFIQVNGYTTVGDPITGPRNSFENVYDYSGSLSWVRGRHEFKFGGGFEHQHINVLQGIATNGFFVVAPFPALPTRLPVS